MVYKDFYRSTAFLPTAHTAFFLSPTGRYLLPNPAAGQAWATSAETSNLVRMRSQALGQSAPSLTASLVSVPGLCLRLVRFAPSHHQHRDVWIYWVYCSRFELKATFNIKHRLNTEIFDFQRAGFYQILPLNLSWNIFVTLTLSELFPWKKWKWFKLFLKKNLFENNFKLTGKLQE